MFTPRERSSPNSFNQRPPAKHIIPRQQQNAKRSQVVWQFAIGTCAHIADKRADRVFKIVSVEIIEGSLLASPDIFVAWHFSYQGTIYFHLSGR